MMVMIQMMAGYLQTHRLRTRDSVVKFLFRNENRGVSLALTAGRGDHVLHG